MNLDDITPVVITFNEEPNIRRCLAGLVWARSDPSGLNATDPMGGLVASSSRILPLLRSKRRVLQLVPPEASQRPSALAATENAGSPPLGATALLVATSHTRNFGPAVLAK